MIKLNPFVFDKHTLIIECYKCQTEFNPLPERVKEWAESGRPFDPTDWECGKCDTHPGGPEPGTHTKGTNQLHTPTTAAALIINARTGKPGVTRARVVAFCREGRLRAQRVGRHWAITAEAIEEFNKTRDSEDHEDD